MRRFLLGLLLLLASSAAYAQAGPNCKFYAINSQQWYQCFNNLADAEAFIRANTDGMHPTRKFLVRGSMDPPAGSMGTDTSGSTDVMFAYGVKPVPGVPGAKEYRGAEFPGGASPSHTLVGCDISGSTSVYQSYGGSSNCSNQPSLCTYGYHCLARSSVIQAIQNAFTDSCHSNATVTIGQSAPASPLNASGGPPDEKPIYPPNTGTFNYFSTDAYGNWTGETLNVAWQAGASCGSPGGLGLVDYVVAPVTCPAGFTFSPASPPRTSDACISNEWGQIQAYVPPHCPDCQRAIYGNPVVASNGEKLQKPIGWSSEAMLGITFNYNSMIGDTWNSLLGGNWAGILSSKFQGRSYYGNYYSYIDEDGNTELFLAGGPGNYRALSGSPRFMRYLTAPTCEVGVWEANRRIVFDCTNYYPSSWPLKRIEYPDAPQQNLTIAWSNSESFDQNGNQTEFPNVPVTITRADGRVLDLLYTRVNVSADCNTSSAPVGCNAIRLSAISDSDGNITLFTYNITGRLAMITYPDGARERFEYGNAADICPASMPGACAGTPSTDVTVGLLTGTYIDTPQAGGGFTSVRYGTYQYDDQGRAIVTTHAGDAGRTELRFQADGTTKIRRYVDATHYSDRVLASQRVNNIFDKPVAMTDKDPGGITLRSSGVGYDALGYVGSTTDGRGVRTDFTSNNSALVTQEIDAASDPVGPTSSRRTIQTDWDTTLRVPTEVRRYDSGTALPGTLKSRATTAYNSRGQRTATCQIKVDDATAMAYACGSSANAPTGVRQSRYVYCEQTDVDAGACPILGELLSVDGPRTDVSDVTTTSYYQSDDAQCGASSTCPHHKGDLWKVTNALGQVTEFLSYEGHGKPKSIKDANGVVTDLGYTSRGWLKTRNVRGVTQASDSVTTFDYDSTGHVTKTTLPDNSYIAFTYDNALRLTDIQDSLGNRIHYALNLAGDHVAEDTRDPGGSLKRTLSRIYDNLDQLQSSVDANAQATTMTYDANGNVDLSTDPLSRITDKNVDSLNRLTQLIANTGGSTSDKATTNFTYDALDNLTKVNDPKQLDTLYIYDGMNDLWKLSSPDTNLTTYAYNAAGQRVSQLDARGKTMSFGYDAIGRLTSQTVPTTAQNVTFAYDTPAPNCASGETFGAGRLAKMTDESGNTVYCYDRRGNLVRKVQTVTGGAALTVGVTYDAANRVSTMTYPSGAIVSYVRNDGTGRITSVGAVPTSGGTQVTLVSNISYLPFGPINTITYGPTPGTRVLTKTFDQNYGIDLVADSATTNPLSEDFSLDFVGNVVGLTERTNATTTVARNFTYDGLNRITAQKNGATNVETFTYNSTGDRLSKGTTSYAYTNSVSNHWLTSVGSTARSYDLAGNTTVIGTTSKGTVFTYDDRGRMRDVKLANKAVASYRYNGRGERVLKTGTSPTSNAEQYVYDEAGHLLGEYTTAGVRIKEYVWLDDTLVAVLGSFDGTTYQYVETDHLGTPRAVIQPTKNVIVWRWDLNNTVFGEHAPNANPDGDSLSYSLNLRFPGQYADAESGLNYNNARDFEPATGRFVESDPAGLIASWNTYSYVDSRPLGLVDPTGEHPVVVAAFLGCVYGCILNSVAGAIPNMKCLYDKVRSGASLSQCGECRPDACEALNRCAKGCIAGGLVAGLAAYALGQSMVQAYGLVGGGLGSMAVNNLYKQLFDFDLCKRAKGLGPGGP